MELLHKELTYVLRGCFFDVHNSLGNGLDEESYHSALEIRLLKSNIPFESKAARFFAHRGIRIYKFIPDLVIDDKIILELKNIQSDFIPANFLQIIS